MGESYKIYTEQEEKEIKAIIESKKAQKDFCSQSMGAMILDGIGKESNTLQEILETLKRIEAMLSVKQSQ